MKNKSIYAAYEEIKQREIEELKNKLKAFGGAAHFGPDYTDEGATGVDCPIVMCNINGFEPHPADVRIMSVGLSSEGNLIIMGCETGNSGCASWDEDEREIPLEDIAYGHIEFITDAIPEIETMKIYIVHIDAIDLSRRHFSEVSDDEIEELYQESNGLIECYHSIHELCKGWNDGELYASDYSFMRIIYP